MISSYPGSSQMHQHEAYIKVMGLEPRAVWVDFFKSSAGSLTDTQLCEQIKKFLNALESELEPQNQAHEKAQIFWGMSVDCAKREYFNSLDVLVDAVMRVWAPRADFSQQERVDFISKIGCVLMQANLHPDIERLVKLEKLLPDGVKMSTDPLWAQIVEMPSAEMVSYAKNFVRLGLGLGAMPLLQFCSNLADLCKEPWSTFKEILQAHHGLSDQERQMVIDKLLMHTVCSAANESLIKGLLTEGANPWCAIKTTDKIAQLCDPFAEALPKTMNVCELLLDGSEDVVYYPLAPSIRKSLIAEWLIEPAVAKDKRRAMDWAKRVLLRFDGGAQNPKCKAILEAMEINAVTHSGAKSNQGSSRL